MAGPSGTSHRQADGALFGGLGPTLQLRLILKSTTTTSSQIIFGAADIHLFAGSTASKRMPPKAKKTSGGGQKPEDEQDDPLQAVVFTDSYETRFSPFTLESPRVGAWSL
jgi:hypothetical protein